MTSVILQFTAGLMAMAACQKWSSHPWKIFSVAIVAMALAMIAADIR